MKFLIYGNTFETKIINFIETNKYLCYNLYVAVE